MQTETRYLYVDNTIEKQNKTKGFTEKYFTVIKVLLRILFTFGVRFSKT